MKSSAFASFVPWRSESPDFALLKKHCLDSLECFKLSSRIIIQRDPNMWDATEYQVLQRGALLQKISLVSGLILFLFAALHFSNHALGLISLDTMVTFQEWRLLVTRSIPGTIVLLAALIFHMGHGLYKLAGRSTFRLPVWEIAQIGLGLLIPFLLLPHIVNTRIANQFFGVQDTYLYELARLWPTSALSSDEPVGGRVAAWMHRYSPLASVVASLYGLPARTAVYRDRDTARCAWRIHGRGPSCRFDIAGSGDLGSNQASNGLARCGRLRKTRKLPHSGTIVVWRPSCRHGRRHRLEAISEAGRAERSLFAISVAPPSMSRRAPRSWKSAGCVKCRMPRYAAAEPAARHAACESKRGPTDCRRPCFPRP